jgi:hypothetical protein
MMLAFDVYSMPYTVIPGSPGGANVHQYLITRAAKVDLITIEDRTLLPPASRFCLRERLEAFAENARQSGVRQQRIYLRPAASREPRGWKAFHQLCPGIDI